MNQPSWFAGTPQCNANTSPTSRKHKNDETESTCPTCLLRIQFFKFRTSNDEVGKQQITTAKLQLYYTKNFNLSGKSSFGYFLLGNNIISLGSGTFSFSILSISFAESSNSSGFKDLPSVHT